MSEQKNEEPWTKEEIYDNEISPLMTRIIAICKEHRIPMVAVFQYCLDEEGGPGHVSTSLPFDERTSPGLRRLMVTPPVCRERPFALAETHVTNPDGSKTISIRQV